jgi:hypothetical protein
MTDRASGRRARKIDKCTIGGGVDRSRRYTIHPSSLALSFASFHALARN